LNHPHIIKAESGPYQKETNFYNSFFTDTHSLSLVAYTISYGQSGVNLLLSVLMEDGIQPEPTAEIMKFHFVFVIA
jgi:hypothetical protein